MKLLKTLSTIFVATFMAFGTAWAQVAQAEAIESPVVFLERTSNQVIQILRDDQELRVGRHLGDDLLGEEAFGADLREGDISDLVTCSLDDLNPGGLA